MFLLEKRNESASWSKTKIPLSQSGKYGTIKLVDGEGTGKVMMARFE